MIHPLVQSMKSFKKIKSFFLSLIFLSLPLAFPTFAWAEGNPSVLRTDGERFATIQEAIDSARDGDEILVPPGTYIENLNFASKRIVLESMSGPSQTILQAADKLNSVVIMNGSTIKGFTITGGTGKPHKSSYGYDYYGGGIYAKGESLIERCIITKNGKGVARSNAGTFAGGVYAGSKSNIIVRDSLIYDNYAWACGGAVLVDHGASIKIENSTIFGNESTNFFGHQGGVGMANGGKVEIVNSIVWGNSGDEIGAFSGIYSKGTDATVTCSLIEGGFTGTGNITSDSPSFLNSGDIFGSDGILGTGDDGLRLTSGSSAIDRAMNHPERNPVHTDLCGYLRVQGQGMDMGCYEFGDAFPKSENIKDNLRTGLIAYYPLDGDASDLTDNGNHGVVYGASLSKDRFGFDDHAYAFDGVDDFIEVPHHQSLNQLPLSISFWFNSNGNQKESGLVSKYSVAAWNGWQVMEFDGNLVPWYLRSHSPKNVIIGKYGESKEFETPLEPKVWNHAVCTFDHESGHVYLNKELMDSKDWTGQAGAVSSSYPLTFGKYLGSRDGFFHGRIDDVRIYDRALSHNEVTQLYELESASELPAKPRPPVGPPTGAPEPLVDYVKLLREIIEEITTVEMELKELVKLGGEKDAEIEKLETELVLITARMSEARSQLKECHEDCNRTREEIAQLKKETLVQNLEITRLEGELRSSAVRLGSLRKDRQDVTLRIKEIEEQMEEAESKMTSAHTPGWHYTPEQGWLWTSAEHYPLIYSNDREGWVYYERGTSQPWLYFDYNSQKWEHWFFSAPLFSSNN
jgi:hypothetical protein